MPNQQNDEGTLEQAVSAARSVEGAVKTGKAIAGAAKGTAAGPYGMLTAAAWENRHLLASGCVVAAILLALPLLFIIMLPGLIFGDFAATGSGTPVMNDNTAIVRNITSLRDSLDSILLEALDDTLKSIDRDFADTGGDFKHVENPFADTGVTGMVDSLTMICQYCASKDIDYSAVKQQDLEQLFRQAKKRFFSWERRVEVVLVPLENEDADDADSTSIPEMQEEKHIYYTITYNGTAYFADEIFNLTAEQKELAAQYSENLHIFLGAAAGSVSGNTLAEIEALLSQYPYTGGASGADGFLSPFLGLDWRSMVTSEFGSRIDPLTNKPGAYHTGLDIAPGYGTEIRACMPGVVIYTKPSGSGYGNHIAINHGNGLVTLYAHCSALLVTAGEEVQGGDVIARVGNTGRVTGPHLHLEVILNGERQDPRHYLP